MTYTANAPSPPKVQQPAYAGYGSAYYGMYVKMWALTVLTFGVYRFWGRTNVRRYIWSCVAVSGEKFAYLGTGGELFKSSIKFVFLLFLPGMIVGLASAFIFHKDPIIESVLNFCGGTFLYILFYAAKFMGLRYRLGRTSWRGIRFELRGSAKSYMLLRLKNFVLNVLSLGLYRPIGDVDVLNFVINKAHFGTLPFRYRGQFEELQQTYYLCWLLFIPTLGCSMCWYKAKYVAHVAKHTTLGPVQFRIKFEGWEYLRFITVNFMLIVFTLGIGYPYVVHRRVEFYMGRARIRGTIDADTIAQAQKKQGAEGGEMSLGFDDFGF